MKLKVIYYSLMLMISVMLFSCGAQYKLATYFDPEKMVPKEFNPSKHILLIAEFPKKDQPDVRHPGYTDKMDKILKQYYPYKYEIVSRKDMLDRNGKYKDTSIYRFGVLDFMGKRTHSSTTTIVRGDNPSNSTTLSPSVTMTTNAFHFYDRGTDQDYPGPDVATSNLGEAFTEFVKVINRAKKTTP